MNLSPDFQIFRIDKNLYGGEQPPYQPEFRTAVSFPHTGMQQELEIFRGLIKNFQAFIDLREDDGIVYDYAEALPDPISYERFPVRDLCAPESPEEMRKILDRILYHLAAGRRVFLHCRGGRGRTGTVAGCYLIRRYGLSGEDALFRLNEIFADSRKGGSGLMCPETAEQIRFILKYAVGQTCQTVNHKKEDDV